MTPFAYDRPTSPDAARAAVTNAGATRYLAGGTTLVDLMKLDVEQPTKLIDIRAMQMPEAWTAIRSSDRGLEIGGLVTMAELSDHADTNRYYPALAQSLQLAASAQIRNMATLAGNVMQRTRCPYFRDVSFPACNKRVPGSGCSALQGLNRSHALLGASDHCVAVYPGDFAQALIALDATIRLSGPRGDREISFADFHLKPGMTPERETVLEPQEMIVGLSIPKTEFARRSLYLKIRDRTSYAFALASAAVALDIADGKVRQARIALGGVATTPWRARNAEEMLVGKPLDEAAAEAAGKAAFAAAKPLAHNAFKVELGRETVTRALLQAAKMEI